MHSLVVSKCFTKTHLFVPTLIYFNRLLFREFLKSRNNFLSPATTYSLVTPKAEIFLIAEAIFTISVGFSKTQIKSGGGHEGSGKITFNLLRDITNVVSVNHPELQIAIASACVLQNISAQSLKGTTVLADLESLYSRNNENLSNPLITEILDNLSSRCIRKGIRENRNDSEVLVFPYRIESQNGNGTHESEDNSHERRVSEFWRKRREEYGTNTDWQGIFIFEIVKGEFAFFDAISGILVSNDKQASAQFSPQEAAFLAAVGQWKQEKHKPSLSDIQRAIFGDQEVTLNEANKTISIVRKSVLAKYRIFTIQCLKSGSNNK